MLQSNPNIVTRNGQIIVISNIVCGIWILILVLEIVLSWLISDYITLIPSWSWSNDSRTCSSQKRSIQFQSLTVLTCLPSSTQSVQVFSSKGALERFCYSCATALLQRRRLHCYNLLILNECGYIVGECLVCKKRVISRKSRKATWKLIEPSVGWS